MRLSQKQMRDIYLRCQGLDGSWAVPRGSSGTLQVVERLGYVQIDSIAVVQRAHHHTLWARQGDYRPEYLDELLAKQRRVFEYWAPAASYVPMADYRYYRPMMNNAAAIHRHVRHSLDAHADVLDQVRDHIRKHGAKGAADFRSPDDGKRGPWWDWRPTKMALEALFALGELMVSERRNFQRIYDLAERILPEGVDKAEPTDAQRGRHAVRRALGLWGALPVREIRWCGSRHAVDGVLPAMLEDGEVRQAEVEGAGDTPHYVLAQSVEDGLARSRRRRRLHILSPFDSAVINRKRLLELFGFDCKLECYLPAAKRRWGYFCLPILFGREFIGRMDAKADRKARRLIVRRMMLEPDAGRVDGFLSPLAKRLREFAAFNDCDDIEVEATVPGSLGPRLRRAL